VRASLSNIAADPVSGGVIVKLDVAARSRTPRLDLVGG